MSTHVQSTKLKPPSFRQFRWQGTVKMLAAIHHGYAVRHDHKQNFLCVKLQGSTTKNTIKPTPV